MKIRFWKRYIYFVELDLVEKKWLQKALTWSDERSGVISSLLYQNEKNGMLFTLDGLLEPLKVKSPYFIEIEQLPEEDLPLRPNIPSDYLLFDEGQSLYPYQIAAIQKAVTGKRGILKIPTGGGKSEVLLGILKYLITTTLIEKALIVVPSSGLAENMYARAIERGLPAEWFGIWGDGKRVTDKIVTIAIVDSVTAGWKKDSPGTTMFLESLDYIGIEECHHLRAKTWADICWAAKSMRYFHGFSATPFIFNEVLEDFGDALVAGLCKGVLCSVSDRFLIDMGAIAQPYICFKRTPGQGKFHPANYAKLYNKNIVTDITRNNMIVEDTLLALKYGLPVFIMVERHEHAELLMKRLKGNKVIAKFGGKDSLQYDEHFNIVNIDMKIADLREGFQSGAWDVLIGSPAMGTGIDISRIGFMIMAGAGRSPISTLQRRGRAVRRKSQGPNNVYIRDYLDMSHAYLKSQSNKRKEHYVSTDSIIVEDDRVFWQMVYEHGKILKELSSNE